MKTYLISYSNGIIYAHVCKSLRAAKQEATKGFTYQMELEGLKVVIYEEDTNNPICYKSFCRFTQKSSSIGKWITI